MHFYVFKATTQRIEILQVEIWYSLLHKAMIKNTLLIGENQKLAEAKLVSCKFLS